MLRLAADEDFNNNILRGLLRRHPSLDFVRVQDAGLCGQDDPAVLDWAAKEGRVLLTHDANTMTRNAYDRVRAGLEMPGLVVASRRAPTRQLIEDILFLAVCAEPHELQGQVLYVPL
jgi:hypothetical protein